MTRWGPYRVAPALFLSSTAFWILEWYLLGTSPALTALLVYFHVSVVGAILLSTFWSVVSECFDPHTLKGLVSRIGAAGTLGGICGGALIERTAHALSTRNTMLVLSGICVLAGASIAQLTRGHVAAAPSDAAPQPRGFTNYLRNIALLVLFSTLATTFIDFALKRSAALQFGNADALVRFFALFYTATALGGFLLQVFVSRRLLQSAGVGVTLATTPGSVLVLGAAAVMSPTLMIVASLKAVESAAASSLFRSAYEPLFAPISAATKRSTKALIDVACDKGGEALGAVIVMIITLAASAELVSRLPLGLAVIAAAAALIFAFRAQRGYVVELETSLRSGTMTLESDEFLDPMAKLTLSGTAIGLDRAKLLENIAQLRAETRDTEGARKSTQLLADIQAIVEIDLPAARQALKRVPLDERLAAFVIPLLAVAGLGRDAVDALRRMGRPAIALMGEVMSLTDASIIVRRRIPHVLRKLRGEQVIDVLTRALYADEFVVRSRAALALREVLTASGAVHPDPEHVVDLVLRELGTNPLSLDSSDHVFNLLVIGTGRDSLELVRQGVRSHDQKLRGTALEYLDSLLPESLRRPMLGALSSTLDLPVPGHRAPSELDAELKRSFVGSLQLPDFPEEIE
jgi:hypothetical protein